MKILTCVGSSQIRGYSTSCRCEFFRLRILYGVRAVTSSFSAVVIVVTFGTLELTLASVLDVFSELLHIYYAELVKEKYHLISLLLGTWSV